MARQSFCFPTSNSVFSLLFSIPLLACSSSGTRDDAGTGGSPNTGGNGGHATAQGGATGSGGSANTGGIQGSGGTATGGASATGGNLGLGGAVATGGNASTGGAMASGGKMGLGGSPGTGGAIGSGGSPGTGGKLSTGGTMGVDGGGATGDFGFTYTKPGAHQVSCTASSGNLTEDVPDEDWLCSFHIDGKTAYVYAQAEATSGQCIMSLIPVFGTASAQISVDGVVSALSNMHYDAGGNHRNNSFQFDYQGKSYKYYHSSFGFGWRACQPMDCVNVYSQGSTTPETEGCSSARSLPEICVPIKADATHDPLVDTFKKCPGDTGK